MIDVNEYRLADEAAARKLVAEAGWAQLVSSTSAGLVASHLPVLLDDEEPFTVLAHLGRPDDELHELGRGESLMIVQGPHGYISPGWYGELPAVPTWNYVAVHLHGTPEPVDEEENLRILAATVDRFELPRDHPVRMEAVAGYAARVARGARSFRFRVDRWQGKSKLSQDKTPEVVDRIVAALADDPIYANPALREAMLREGRRAANGPAR
jgi:transcriptional regulator